MSRFLCIVLLALFSAVYSSRADVEPRHAFTNFVSVRGDQLFDGAKPLRFLAFNIPNLLLIEDDVAFTKLNPWRLPDRFEITDALATARQLGGTVARTYVISVRRTNDAPDQPKHVLGPGQFNEDAFRALDTVLQVANEQGVRLILPLVDNWIWMGGRAEYAAWRGVSKDAFWTDPQVIADFKQTIRFILTRTNTLTGIRYSDDKAILCWETGNEIDSPPEWTREIAAYIKSLDRNHLVMDGFNASELRAASLEIPEIDIVTTHHYPGGRKTFPQLIQENREKARGRKPYVVGEFGFVDTDRMAEAIRAIEDTGTAGGLLWSLRFRNCDGGFYWHSEPLGGNQYKAFHWPPSEMGAAYDETRLMNLVRERAFSIRGTSPPPIPIPAAPRLLPITDPGLISWQGSVGASAYSVERSRTESGPWEIVGRGIDEALAQYRPLFSDETAPRGTWFYRVRAMNGTGSSPPSNVVGPVTVTQVTIIDELANLDRVQARNGNWEIRTRDCRKAKEDAHRAAGNAGDTLSYRAPGALERVRLYAFFPRDIADPIMSVSADGVRYTPMAVEKESYFHGAGDYDYWKPVLYTVTTSDPSHRFVRIEARGEIQIGRIEIRHAPQER
jgi:hypothetical protein